jgi:hypothetical protein
LQLGSYTFVESERGANADAQLYAFLREAPDEKVLVVVNMDVNTRADGVHLHLPAGFAKYVLHDLLTGEKFKREGSDLIICLGPGESHIFRVES